MMNEKIISMILIWLGQLLVLIGVYVLFGLGVAIVVAGAALCFLGFGLGQALKRG